VRLGAGSSGRWQRQLPLRFPQSRASCFAMPNPEQALHGDGDRGPTWRRTATSHCGGKRSRTPVRGLVAPSYKDHRRPRGLDVGCRREEGGGRPVARSARARGSAGSRPPHRRAGIEQHRRMRGSSAARRWNSRHDESPSPLLIQICNERRKAKILQLVGATRDHDPRKMR
jgi:hypothetical protein